MNEDEKDFDRQLPDLILTCKSLRSGEELTHRDIQFGKHCWLEARRTLREKLLSERRGPFTGIQG